MKSAVKYAFAAIVLASGPGALAQENLEPAFTDDGAMADYGLSDVSSDRSGAASLEPGLVEVSDETMQLAGQPDFPVQAVASQENSGKEITFILSPYVWIPTVTGDISVGTQDLRFELDAGDLLKVFEFGGLIRGELRHESGWGLSADYVFADLGAGVDIVIGNVDADIKANILELAVVRRVPLDQHSLDVYGGIRRWDADLEIAIETFFFDDVIVTGDEWVDPIVGARYLHTLSPKWRLIAQADIGGFGAGSEFTWNGVAGASLAVSDKAQFQLVYRALGVNRKSPGPNGSAPVDLNLTIQGPLIGFAYRF